MLPTKFRFIWLRGFRGEDDGRQTPSDGKSSHYLWQGELKKIKNFGCCPILSYLYFEHNKSHSKSGWHTAYTEFYKEWIHQNLLKNKWSINKKQKIPCLASWRPLVWTLLRLESTKSFWTFILCQGSLHLNFRRTGELEQKILYWNHNRPITQNDCKFVWLYKNKIIYLHLLFQKHLIGFVVIMFYSEKQILNILFFYTFTSMISHLNISFIMVQWLTWTYQFFLMSLLILIFKNSQIILFENKYGA
jgi:hypothetical protein